MVMSQWGLEKILKIVDGHMGGRTPKNTITLSLPYESNGSGCYKRGPLRPLTTLRGKNNAKCKENKV